MHSFLHFSLIYSPFTLLLKNIYNYVLIMSSYSGFLLLGKSLCSVWLVVKCLGIWMVLRGKSFSFFISLSMYSSAQAAANNVDVLQPRHWFNGLHPLAMADTVWCDAMCELWFHLWSLSNKRASVLVIVLRKL